MHTASVPCLGCRLAWCSWRRTHIAVHCESGFPLSGGAMQLAAPRSVDMASPRVVCKASIKKAAPRKKAERATQGANARAKPYVRTFPRCRGRWSAIVLRWNVVASSSPVGGATRGGNGRQVGDMTRASPPRLGGGRGRRQTWVMSCLVARLQTSGKAARAPSAERQSVGGGRPHRRPGCKPVQTPFERNIWMGLLSI